MNPIDAEEIIADLGFEGDYLQPLRELLREAAKIETFDQDIEDWLQLYADNIELEMRRYSGHYRWLEGTLRQLKVFADKRKPGTLIGREIERIDAERRIEARKRAEERFDKLGKRNSYVPTEEKAR